MIASCRSAYYSCWACFTCRQAFLWWHQDVLLVVLKLVFHNLFDFFFSERWQKILLDFY